MRGIGGAWAPHLATPVEKRATPSRGRRHAGEGGNLSVLAIRVGAPMNRRPLPWNGTANLINAALRKWGALFPSPLMSAGMAHRAVMLTSAYLATSIVVLASAVGLGQIVSPSMLAGVLSVFFISMLSSGLEPGTAKAFVLQGVAPAVGKEQLQGIALASIAKAVWWPWPWTLVPANTLADPSSCTSHAPNSTWRPTGAVTST